MPTARPRSQGFLDMGGPSSHSDHIPAGPRTITQGAPSSAPPTSSPPTTRRTPRSDVRADSPVSSCTVLFRSSSSSAVSPSLCSLLSKLDHSAVDFPPIARRRPGVVPRCRGSSPSCSPRRRRRHSADRNYLSLDELLRTNYGLRANGGRPNARARADLHRHNGPVFVRAVQRM